jgi:hypothetical protein
VASINDKPGSLTVTARISRSLQTPPESPALLSNRKREALIRQEAPQFLFPVRTIRWPIFGRRPFDFGRPVVVNHRKFLRFVWILRSYCPMRNFLLIEGSSCLQQPSHEDLRRNAVENAL